LSWRCLGLARTHFHFTIKVRLTKSFIESTTIVWKAFHLGLITTSTLTTTSAKREN
jgi:hypothetical protein